MMKPLAAGIAFLLFLAACQTAPIPDSSEPVPSVATRPDLPPAVSLDGVFGGKPLSYTAQIERFAVQSGVEKRGADIVSVSYTANLPQTASERPVLFVFNGGPITASLYLHIGAVGPVRLAVPDDLTADPSTFELVPNPYSPLDAADLVFFDPASTGLSWVADGVDPLVYASVQEDAAQFVAFAEAWLERHRRTGAPIFLLGESYGTMRAAEAAGQIAEAHPDLNLQGVFLMGQAVNIIEYSQRTENIISYVVSLPTLAATAWEFGKVDAKDRSFENFMSDAASFADTEYLGALYQGLALPEATKIAIAAALEAYTGVSADYYIEHNLRISKETFRVELLKAEGLVLGRSDARYTAPATPDVPTPDASAVLGAAYVAAFGKYFAATFGTPLPADYQAVATVVGMGDWDWGAKSPFDQFAYGKRLNLAFDVNPDFRLVIANGYHDTMTTVGAARYALLQSSWPQDRVKLSWYHGGHMAYSIDASAAAFGNDIRAWIRGEA